MWRVFPDTKGGLQHFTDFMSCHAHKGEYDDSDAGRKGTHDIPRIFTSADVVVDSVAGIS